jgi:hypothetical protein
MSKILELINLSLNQDGSLNKVADHFGISSLQTKNAIDNAAPLLIAALSRPNELGQESWQNLSGLNAESQSELDNLVEYAFNKYELLHYNFSAQFLGDVAYRVEEYVSRSSGVATVVGFKIINFVSIMVAGAVAKLSQVLNLTESSYPEFFKSERDSLVGPNMNLAGAVGQVFDEKKQGEHTNEEDKGVIDSMLEQGSAFIDRVMGKAGNQ